MQTFALGQPLISSLWVSEPILWDDASISWTKWKERRRLKEAIWVGVFVYMLFTQKSTTNNLLYVVPTTHSYSAQVGLIHGNKENRIHFCLQRQGYCQFQWIAHKQINTFGLFEDYKLMLNHMLLKGNRPETAHKYTRISHKMRHTKTGKTTTHCVENCTIPSKIEIGLSKLHTVFTCVNQFYCSAAGVFFGFVFFYLNV